MNDHGSLLWGNAAYVAAFALLAASSTGDSASGFDVDELPSVVSKKDGESVLVPCAEVLLNEKAVDTMISAGLMPLLSDASRPAVKFVRAQSVASPPTPLELASAD